MRTTRCNEKPTSCCEKQLRHSHLRNPCARISNTSATSDTMYPTRIKSGCRVYVDLLINIPKDKTQQMSVLTREVILWLELQAGSSRIAHCRAIDLAEAIGSPKRCVNRALATLKARGYVAKITHNRIELRAYDPETRFTWLYPNWFTSEALTPAEKHIISISWDMGGKHTSATGSVSQIS